MHWISPTPATEQQGWRLEEDQAWLLKGELADFGADYPQ